MNFHAKNKLLGQSLIFENCWKFRFWIFEQKIQCWHSVYKTLFFYCSDGWASHWRFSIPFERKKEMEIRSGILESQRKSKMFTNWKRSTGWPNKIWPYLPVPLVFLVPFMVFWSGFTPYRITQDSSTALGARDCFRG